MTRALLPPAIALCAASRAMRSGRQQGAAAALPRLAAMPGMPRANRAAVAPDDALRRTAGRGIRHR